MARYGYGYDYRSGGYRDGYERHPFHDRDAGRWGWSREGRDHYTEDAEWSRPEFNASLGHPGPARAGWAVDEWQSYDVHRGDQPGRWRTGEPWGRGRSAADELCACDIMTENPEAVTPDATLAEVARRMRDLDVGIIPVVDSLDRCTLRGVITDRDIAVRAAAEGRDMMTVTAGDYMTRDVETVREGDTVRDVFTVMKKDRVRRVPVTDESGRLVGIIAQADLAVDYAGLDEQRELEVEEVIERISEPGRFRSGGGWSPPHPGLHGTRGWEEPEGYERDFRDRLRRGWQTLRREARGLLDRGDYDGGWR